MTRSEENRNDQSSHGTLERFHWKRASVFLVILSAVLFVILRNKKQESGVSVLTDQEIPVLYVEGMNQKIEAMKFGYDWAWTENGTDWTNAIADSAMPETMYDDLPTITVSDTEEGSYLGEMYWDVNPNTVGIYYCYGEGSEQVEIEPETGEDGVRIIRLNESGFDENGCVMYVVDAGFDTTGDTSFPHGAAYQGRVNYAFRVQLSS